MNFNISEDLIHQINGTEFESKETELLRSFLKLFNDSTHLLETLKETFNSFKDNVDTNPSEMFDVIYRYQQEMEDLSEKLESLNKSLSENNQQAIVTFEQYETQKHELIGERDTLCNDQQNLNHDLQNVVQNFVTLEDIKKEAKIQKQEQIRKFADLINKAYFGLPAAGARIGIIAGREIVNNFAVGGIFGKPITHNEEGIFSNKERKESENRLIEEMKNITADLEYNLLQISDITKSVELLSTKIDIFRKIFIIVCDFQVFFKKCHQPLIEFINVFESYFPVSSHSERLVKKNNEKMMAKLTETLVLVKDFYNNIHVNQLTLSCTE